MSSKEFKINRFLSLKLSHGQTFIYVNDREFRQCKYVLFNLPVIDIDRYKSTESIDELIDEFAQEGLEKPRDITPEAEFWAHCSNLQAWAEHGYNTDLLDYRLSFPLLEKLSQEGDLQAKRIFKEEIARRLMRGDLYIAGSLIREYSEILTKDESELVFSSENSHLFEKIFECFKSDDLEVKSEAEKLYLMSGKHFFNPLKKKLIQSLNNENLEDLYIIINWRLIDILSDSEILGLSKPPINFIERTIDILNRNMTKIRGDYELSRDLTGESLFSERVKKIYEKKIKKVLIPLIHKGNLKYNLLWRLNLIDYVRDEDLEHLL